MYVENNQMINTYFQTKSTKNDTLNQLKEIGAFIFKHTNGLLHN